LRDIPIWAASSATPRESRRRSRCHLRARPHDGGLHSPRFDHAHCVVRTVEALAAQFRVHCQRRVGHGGSKADFPRCAETRLHGTPSSRRVSPGRIGMDGRGCRARLNSDGCSGSGSECNAACGHCPGLRAPRAWIGRATCDRPSNPSPARLACAHSSPGRNCACRPLPGGAVLPGSASRLRSHRVGAGTGLHARPGDGHARASAPSPGEGDLALCCCRIWSVRRSRRGHRRCRFSLGTRRCLVRYNSSFRRGRSDHRCCGRTPSELGICRRLRAGAGGWRPGSSLAHSSWRNWFHLARNLVSSPGSRKIA